MFDLKNDSYIQLSVFDMLGREVANLSNGFERRGIHSVIFNANDLSSGCYFYSLKIHNSEWLQVRRYSKALLIIK